MPSEFRGVHTLDFSNTRLIMTFQLNAGRILEHIGSLRHVIDKEVAPGISRGFIVGQALLVIVSTQYSSGVGATAALVFQMDELQISIRAQLEAHDQLVTHGYWSRDWFENL